MYPGRVCWSSPHPCQGAFLHCNIAEVRLHSLRLCFQRLPGSLSRQSVRKVKKSTLVARPTIISGAGDHAGAPLRNVDFFPASRYYVAAFAFYGSGPDSPETIAKIQCPFHRFYEGDDKRRGTAAGLESNGGREDRAVSRRTRPDPELCGCDAGLRSSPETSRGTRYSANSSAEISSLV